MGKAAGDALDLSHEQALLARARRQALEHEAQIRQAAYTPTSQAVESSRRAGLAIRDSMLSVPGRIAARLVGLADEREIERRVTDEMRQELTRIARSVAAPDA